MFLVVVKTLRCHGNVSTIELTNENEGHRNNEREDVATDWLVVLAMSLGKEVQDLVDVVFTQCLRTDRA